MTALAGVEDLAVILAARNATTYDIEITYSDACAIGPGTDPYNMRSEVTRA